MKHPRDTYPHAIVPEHLSKLTIEKLPLDRIYYVAPGERDDYEETPAIFKSPDHTLVMSKFHAIDMADEYPASPVGMVGIMKTFHINPDTNAVQEHYVADLRFIGDHDLIDMDDITAAEDQEEYMARLNVLENSITFSAFIAADPDIEVRDNGTVHGAFYGNPLLHDALEKMDKRGNKQMKKFLKRQKTSAKLAQTAKNATDTGNLASLQQSDSKQQQEKKDLSVQFFLGK